MSIYRNADPAAQWFADTYPGSALRLTPETMVLVLHTTEGASWPDYNGGSTAPNYTGLPSFKNRHIVWRAHFPDEMSSRALRNLSGGVETNTLNAVQVELIGTCDPAKRTSWNGLKAGVHYIFWPEAPQWALMSLARFVADMHKRHGLRLVAPEFLPYPSSYGDSPARFSFEKWRGFAGICGHQHVPENSHGDPGALDVSTVLRYAQALISPPNFRITFGKRDHKLRGDMHVGPRQHVLYKDARLRLKGTADGVTWTRLSWFSHRLCVISWTHFSRVERRRIKVVVRNARRDGYDVILVGRPGDSKVFTPRRLARRLNLHVRLVDDVLFAFPADLKSPSPQKVGETFAFELEKPK